MVDDLVSHMVPNDPTDTMIPNEGIRSAAMAQAEELSFPLAAAQPWGAPSSQEDLRRIQLHYQAEHEEQMRLQQLRQEEQFAHRLAFRQMFGNESLLRHPALMQHLHHRRFQVTGDHWESFGKAASHTSLFGKAEYAQVFHDRVWEATGGAGLSSTEVPIVMFDDAW